MFFFEGEGGGIRLLQVQNMLSHFNNSVLTLKKLIHSVRSTKKKRIYLIIVLIYNLDGDNKSDINTYEYITNDK